MYLIGAGHPHKAEAQLILERLVAARERLVTDAEVFFTAIRPLTGGSRLGLHFS